jgi:peptidoglycan/LPS O-acetylase OafA/YrhL
VKKIFSVGHFGVQMFFVISGFIIPWSMYYAGYELKNFFRFTGKRLIRLEPPYMISLMLAIAHTYIRTMSPHYNGVDITPTAKQIALHFGYLIPFFKGETWIRPVYWTLAVEFQYYLCIGLFFPLIKSTKLQWRLISYLVLFSGPILIKGGFLPFHLPVFMLGIALFQYKTNIIQKKEFIILTLICIIEMAIFHETGTLVASLITYLAILFMTGWRPKILSFLGDISYSVYLFHSLTGMVILNYFSHSVHHPLMKFLVLIFALAVTLLISYGVFRLIEKPSKKLSSSIKFRK